ncbi:MAG: hypothetical protein AUI14_25425 [Actinobacteria bacterium 13_2_20CM_2_71_6]|nr:MAG: hypothetical protein AUI14_25425 [Actinobacteria bacterium 13_2_20CM_2_71_6]
MSTVVNVWAAVCLTVVVALVLAARRLGRERAAAWLVVIGVVLLTLEEPALLFWLGVADPRADHDGVATLVTPMARAHIIDAGVYGVGAAVLLGWIAMTALRRGDRWARRVLAWGLAVVAATEAATVLLVFSRGLPAPGPGGEAGESGFGWSPLAVGLLAWAAGLWLTRPTATVDARALVRSGS